MRLAILVHDPYRGAEMNLFFGLTGRIDHDGPLELCLEIAQIALDFPHLADRCRALLARIRDAQGGAIDGSAHLPSMDAPQAFEVRLKSFLAGLEA